MVFSKSAFAALLQSGVALAATVNVNVGGNKALVFSPTTVTANAGDVVKFTFLDQNHTATAGNPNAGCKPSGLFNSGFVPVANNTNTLPTFSVAVTNTNPITVYCAQAIHCQSGMVMVINPTTSGATSLAAYQQLSAGATTNTPAKAVNGGVLKNAQTTTTTTTTTGAGTTAAKGGKTGKAKTAKAPKAPKTGGKKTNRRFALNRLNARQASTLVTSVTGSAATGLPPLPSAVGTAPTAGAATNGTTGGGTAPCHTGKGGGKAKKAKKGKKTAKGAKGGHGGTNGTAIASTPAAAAAASSATLVN